MPVIDPTQADSTATTLSTGADHWLALTSTGSVLKWYIDGSLVETMTFSMRRFRSVQLTEVFGLNQGTGVVSPTIDVRDGRIWGRVLSLVELTAEAASASPVSTSGLLSNVGLTSTSDLSDTVSSIAFVSSGTPTTDSGYIQFNHYNDRITRTAGFLDASMPFSLLFHLKLSATSPDPSSFFDTHFLSVDGTPSGYPYIWIGNYTPGALDYYVQVYLGGNPDAPQIPLDTSVECCDTTSGGGGTNAGDVKRPADPAWTPSCAGGGSVATAADLTVSEDWSA